VIKRSPCVDATTVFLRLQGAEIRIEGAVFLRDDDLGGERRRRWERI